MTVIGALGGGSTICKWTSVRRNSRSHPLLTFGRKLAGADDQFGQNADLVGRDLIAPTLPLLGGHV